MLDEEDCLEKLGALVRGVSVCGLLTSGLDAVKSAVYKLLPVIKEKEHVVEKNDSKKEGA